MSLSPMSDTHAGDTHRVRRNAGADTEAVLAEICRVLQGLRFGSVTIVVQDGVVVQIDRTEKRRLPPNAQRPEKSASVVPNARETHT